MEEKVNTEFDLLDYILTSPYKVMSGTTRAYKVAYRKHHKIDEYHSLVPTSKQRVKARNTSHYTEVFLKRLDRKK